jgi:4-diphosphocytidyl-2-C-methyl-D-erythritol kinase
LLVFPNAKINLGLNIIEKRPDGFHNIESVFYPINWVDILEIQHSSSFVFETSGLPVPGDPAGNLIVKAVDMLIKNGHLEQNNLFIHLHKVIPMGAGLGGGSADGAFALSLLNELFELNISTEKLQAYAEYLGSDCPFFIVNRPKYCTQKGTTFEDIDLSLKPYALVVVNPEIHVSTAEAYAGVRPLKPEVSIKEIVKMPITNWKNYLKNDFETSVVKNHPKIGALKAELYKLGAIYASMTGSGSTVYGIFEKPVPNLKSIFPDYICWQDQAYF